jgi:SAM-dependent methyltransferase
MKHFDVGSRVDGYIAHLLSFREVTLLDIRPNTLNIPNLKIVIGDAQLELDNYKNEFDSVSSLHSIEHFGLGRYGDNLQVDGHEKGLLNIARCVKVAGFLYVSFPIGMAKVEFNSQRIVDPAWPIKVLDNFELVEFILIPWKGQPSIDVLPSQVDKSKAGQAGLYKFKRLR